MSEFMTREAWAAVEKAIGNGPMTFQEFRRITDAISAAAPYILAAELDEQAEYAASRAASMAKKSHGELPMPVYVARHGTHTWYHHRFRELAAQLRRKAASRAVEKEVS